MRRFLLLAASAAIVGCASTAPLPPATGAAPAVTLTILQLNDVYEITPVEGGRWGGLARVATLREQLLREDPDVITVMAGDFFSPSALGTARVDGERLNGRQMVAVLNVLGLDLAAFGNHEFDLDEQAFRTRLGESTFRYLSANAFEADGSAFPGVPRDTVITITDAGGTARIGFTGVVLDATQKAYVSYTSALEALAERAGALQPRTDAMVALTHLALADDIAAAEATPAYDILLGGHEHENIDVRRGPDLTPIRKADANARTVWVHRFQIRPGARSVQIDSELVPITDDISENAAVAAEVARWVEAGYAGFRDAGFEPDRVVVTTDEPLDGREATVRTRPTPLGSLIAEAYFRNAEAAGARPDLALFNSGSVRVDDVLPAGPITEYDVIRVLPFGGTVLTVDIAGATLDSVLTQGVANRGTGGFLHAHGAELTDQGGWLVAGGPIDRDRIYRVTTSDFLVSGREAGLSYLNVETNPNVRPLATHDDVRRAVINELMRRYR
jgi:5'-nucleotidase